jgi:membrane protease YdiL (CAAX protease family)
MRKSRIYLLGLATLAMGPAGWIVAGMPSLESFLQWNTFQFAWMIIGLEFGIVFGFFMLLITSSEKAQFKFSSQINLLKSLRLTFFDILFLSLCAGFGEELLFRVGLQTYVHPILASLIFVAIHGYLLPNDWDTTKYGLLIFLFIVVLSFAVSNEQGLWFCIAAHSAYDFVLFYHWSKQPSQGSM